MKKRIFSGIWMLGVLMLAAPVGFAKKFNGIEVDDSVMLNNQALKINGIGQRTQYALVKVYVAALYTTASRKQAESVLDSAEPKRLLMVMNRKLTNHQLNRALIEGLKANNSAADLGRLHTQIAQLSTIIMSGIVRNVQAGDTVAIDFLPTGLKLIVNGTERGAIKGNELNIALLKVWLGDHPVQADLKKALLGTSVQ